MRTKYILIMLIFSALLMMQCQKDKVVQSETIESSLKVISQDNIEQYRELLKQNGMIIQNDNLDTRDASITCATQSSGCTYLGVVNTQVTRPCTTDVSYKLWWCSGGIEITDFTFSPTNSMDCDKYKNYWNSLGSNNHFDEYVISIDSFEYWAGIDAEDAAAKIFIDFMGINCPNTVATSKFFRKLCYSWCFRLTPFQTPPWDIRKIICGSTCCQRTRELCNDNGVIVQVGPTVFTNTGGTCTPTTTGGCSNIGDVEIVACQQNICGEPQP